MVLSGEQFSGVLFRTDEFRRKRLMFPVAIPPEGAGCERQPTKSMMPPPPTPIIVFATIRVSETLAVAPATFASAPP